MAMLLQIWQLEEAVTSDQVVTLMGERWSVCLCHREAAGWFWIHSSQGGGEERRGCGAMTIKGSRSAFSAQNFQLWLF